MDTFFGKSRKRNVARASHSSALSLDTSSSILSDTAIQFDKLPTSSSPRPPPIPYSIQSQSNNDRLSRALEGFHAPPSPTASHFTGHASITPPVHLIAKVIPPTHDGFIDPGTELPYVRPGSPSEHSIRSVGSSSRGDDRRRRTESLQGVPGEDGRRSAASVHSNGDQAKPLPLSPQKKYAGNGRTNSSGGDSSYGAGDPGSGRHTPSLMSQSSYTSAYTTPSSSRADNRSQHSVVSSLSSSAVPLYARRGSTSSVATRPATLFGDGTAPALPAPSPYSAEFDFARPSSPTMINLLFEELLPKLASTPKAFEDMRALDPDKKWIMLHNAAFSKWKTAREKLTHRPVDARSAPAVGTSNSGGGRDQSRAGERTPNKLRAKNESPEWYIARFMDGTVTAANVASLSVCLRTYELE